MCSSLQDPGANSKENTYYLVKLLFFIRVLRREVYLFMSYLSKSGYSTLKYSYCGFSLKVVPGGRGDVHLWWAPWYLTVNVIEVHGLGTPLPCSLLFVHPPLRKFQGIACGGEGKD
jgi:hypothetical protein